MAVRIDAERDIRKRTVSVALEGLPKAIVIKAGGEPEEQVIDGSKDTLLVLEFAADDAADFVRKLCDAFASVGVQAESYAPEVRRLEAHLADMRTLALRGV